MICILWFLAWTLLIYWSHRIAHVVPMIKRFHLAHHRFIALNPSPIWHWSNLFLFQDDIPSTIEVVLTEFIPTVIFCLVTNQWWILIGFYMWSAFIQESIEHNPDFNWYPWLTSGKWHLAHHRYGNCNYGIFVSWWDRIFGTYQRI